LKTQNEMATKLEPSSRRQSLRESKKVKKN